jgi:C_GCAxxG_C_C family probable redox protein
VTSRAIDDKQQIAERAYELAFKYEATHGCCPQCVLAAVDDVLHIGGDEVFKAAHGLAGGGGLSGNGTCGALVGATLAVGARHGRDRANFANDSYMHSFALAKRVHDAFVDKFGSPICSEVQTKIMGRSYDLWDHKDFKAFLADGGHGDKCTNVAGTAARIAAEVLLEADEKPPRLRNTSGQ